MLLAWGLGAALSVPAFRDLHLTGAAAGWGVLASAPMLAGLVLVLRSPWPPLVRLRQQACEIAGLFSRCTLLDLAVISVLAGIGEEALFRGVMQTALADPVGLPAAVVLASVAFGLAHFLSFTYAVYAAVVGAYLGVLLIGFDNLLVPVVAHAVYDFAALVYLVRMHRTA